MIVFIPTAGIGSRLNEETTYLNKSLLDINNKPIISYIIEKFPKNTRFVIALGYKGYLVKQYLKLAHPNIKFTFVNILPFKGVKSGLGLTLLKSSKYLQDKFIFISCDTLINSKIKFSNNNWIGYSSKKAGAEYRSVDIKNGQLLRINEKNKIYKDKKTYIGLAYIKNYKEFWKYTKSNYKISKSQGEVFAINQLLKKKKIIAKSISWHDVGNLLNYKVIKSKYSKKNKHVILPKKKEGIWFINNHVLKYSLDEKFIRKRTYRAKILNNFVPKILKSSKNIYVYKYVNGKIMSKNLTLYNFKKLMKFLKNFWKINININQKNFQKKCLKFYKNKTLNRIKIFNKNYNLNKKNQIINNSKTENIKVLLKKIDWTELSRGIASRFHGDLHFDNIIIQKKKFKFIDWRQDFENNLKNGDIYYDLAKLLHGIIVDHNQVNKNNYKIKINNNKIFINIKKSKNHIISRKYLENWIVKNGYNIKKVRILTALIYLNIAPLHHYPYSLFLYFLGKKMLSDELKKK